MVWGMRRSAIWSPDHWIKRVVYDLFNKETTSTSAIVKDIYR